MRFRAAPYPTPRPGLLLRELTETTFPFEVAGNDARLIYYKSMEI